MVRTQHFRGARRSWRWGLFGLLGLFACDPVTFYWNNTASLAGPPTDANRIPGTRGNIQVAFINNTPHRAIFTLGTYDPLNQVPDLAVSFPPLVEQFAAGDDPANRLEGNSQSQIFEFACGRAVSVGGPELLDVIRKHEIPETANRDALVELEPGVGFSDRPVDDPEAGQATAGRADSVITFQGAEYECESLLVYTFELVGTDPNVYRIDLDVILP